MSSILFDGISPKNVRRPGKIPRFCQQTSPASRVGNPFLGVNFGGRAIRSEVNFVQSKLAENPALTGLEHQELKWFPGIKAFNSTALSFPHSLWEKDQGVRALVSLPSTEIRFNKRTTTINLTPGPFPRERGEQTPTLLGVTLIGGQDVALYVRWRLRLRLPWAPAAGGRER